MNPDPGALSLGAAFAAGLAATGHCIGMCGGIAGALAMRSPRATPRTKLALALAYNFSRIASYVVAGAIAGLLGRTLLKAVDIAPLSVAFRVVAGLIMLAAPARLLFGWRLLDPLESAGSGLWRRIAPWAGRQGHPGGIGGAISLRATTARRRRVRAPTTSRLPRTVQPATPRWRGARPTSLTTASLRTARAATTASRWPARTRVTCSPVPRARPATRRARGSPPRASTTHR